jgi:predicted glutamine amidotransferase
VSQKLTQGRRSSRRVKCGPRPALSATVRLDGRASRPPRRTRRRLALDERSAMSTAHGIGARHAVARLLTRIDGVTTATEAFMLQRGRGSPTTLMARMFGFIGNRADLGPLIIATHAQLLRARRTAREAWGWGIGFNQSGEMLLRRRPLDDREVIDLSVEARGIRTDLLLAHVRTPRVGGLSTENTQPFRYRGWLFAHSGTIAGFDRIRSQLLELMPEFLRQNVLGDTDSEVLFYSFLALLHGAGHLASASAREERLRAALRQTAELVDRLCAEQGLEEHRGNLLLADADSILAVHREGTMSTCVLKGRRVVERLAAEDVPRAGRAENLDNTRFCLVVSEPDVVPPDWTMLPLGTISTLTRTHEPRVEAL